MSRLERYQTVLVFAGVAVGLLTSQVEGVAAVADHLILPLLLVMLFAVFARVPLPGLRQGFRNRRVVGSSLAVNFVWNPLLAVALGFVFLRDHPALWVGLVMLMVTPCTDWYLVFTDLADGDVPLATSLLPYNLVLQLVLLPVYLYLFADELVDLPLGVLVESVILVLVVPVVLASSARRLLPRLWGEDWFRESFLPLLSPLQVVFLVLAVTAMFASQGDAVVEDPWVLALMALPVIVFYVVNFGVALAVGRYLELDYDEVVCLGCTVLSRNSPTALAIAVIAFPDEPVIALALVVGPLLELPLLSVVSRLFLGIRERGLWEQSGTA
ncbi:MAG: arsenic resistance protein [Halobacteriota archaeon]